ncbi:MAG TPA: hypothetical protein VI564_01615 [Candidatus Nanoarchaeia archaeon]|nr:hypothetical protein [Candidatus Nanoarchaeia archaeon]
MKTEYLRLLVLVIVVLLVLNLVLFAMKRIGQALFWGFIIAAALFAYLALPRLKEQKTRKNKNN